MSQQSTIRFKDQREIDIFVRAIDNQLQARAIFLSSINPQSITDEDCEYNVFCNLIYKIKHLKHPDNRVLQLTAQESEMSRDLLEDNISQEEKKNYQLHKRRYAAIRKTLRRLSEQVTIPS